MVYVHAVLATRASPTASEAVLGGRPLGRITPTLSVGATAALLAVTLRVPFWGAPLTADEGGYAEAARLWSRGWQLYTDVWVDRPQGLVLGFRAIRWLGLTSPQELRVAAATIGLLVLGATALVTYRLAGRQVAIVAALLLAVAGSSPYIESFTLSGELLALLPTLLALLALTGHARRRRPGWLVGARLRGIPLSSARDYRMIERAASPTLNVRGRFSARGGPAGAEVGVGRGALPEVPVE